MLSRRQVVISLSVGGFVPSIGFTGQRQLSDVSGSSRFPAWRTGLAVNKLTKIPVALAGIPPDRMMLLYAFYSGAATDFSDCEIYVAGTGGHSVGTDAT